MVQRESKFIFEIEFNGGCEPMPDISECTDQMLNLKWGDETHCDLNILKEIYPEDEITWDYSGEQEIIVSPLSIVEDDIFCIDEE